MEQKKPRVQCEDVEFDNVWMFKYLGSLFRADEDQKAGVSVRIAAATSHIYRWKDVCHLGVKVYPIIRKTEDLQNWCMLKLRIRSMGPG